MWALHMKLNSTAELDFVLKTRTEQLDEVFFI